MTSIAISHPKHRWATRRKESKENSHPRFSPICASVSNCFVSLIYFNFVISWFSILRSLLSVLFLFFSLLMCLFLLLFMFLFLLSPAHGVLSLSLFFLSLAVSSLFPLPRCRLCWFRPQCLWRCYNDWQVYAWSHSHPREKRWTDTGGNQTILRRRREGGEPVLFLTLLSFLSISSRALRELSQEWMDGLVDTRSRRMCTLFFYCCCCASVVLFLRSLGSLRLYAISMTRSLSRKLLSSATQEKK